MRHSHCAGVLTHVIAPDRVLLYKWLELPGVSIAIEAGIRHMGRSEREMSQLRPLALQLLMVDSNLLPCTWTGMARNFTSQSSSAYTACVSLYVSLFKLLKNELSHVHYNIPTGTIRGYQSPVDMAQLLSMIGRFVIFSRPMWEGTSVDDVTCGPQCSSKTECEHNAVEAWLRLQLILLRSWFMLWVEMSCSKWKSQDEGYHDRCTQAARDAQLGMMPKFLELCRAGQGSPLMEAALAACGYTSAVDWRVEQEVRGSQAGWECFAFFHLQGRTLPGCSYWGCRNLDGLSEAALPTQLCGGCRRARYCSTTCQKDAWVKGGHWEVCGSI